jgi:hypothetical protein
MENKMQRKEREEVEMELSLLLSATLRLEDELNLLGFEYRE